MTDILYKNKDFIVINKPVGADSEKDVPLLLEKEGIRGAKVFHRLDREVGGIMLLTLSKDAPSILTNTEFEKIYIAEIIGCPTEKSGEMVDFLYHDRTKNKTYTVKKMRNGVKEAKLSYEVVKEGENSIVKVRLFTGRTHQIRVQFASRKHPIIGDGKYGGGSGDIHLFSSSLSFDWKNERLSFSLLPEWYKT